MDDEREVAATVEVAALATLFAAPARPTAVDDETDDVLVLTTDEHEEPLAVLPRQRDEFCCPRCFLVVHVSRREGSVCRDCR